MKRKKPGSTTNPAINHRRTASTCWGAAPSKLTIWWQEICRCERIVELHRNDPDQEVKDYCQNQTDRASRLASELAKKVNRSLTQGSFVFRGKVTAVDSLDSSLAAACKKHLNDAAERVFDRYPTVHKLAIRWQRAQSLGRPALWEFRLVEDSEKHQFLLQARINMAVTRHFLLSAGRPAGKHFQCGRKNGFCAHERVEFLAGCF